jgi:hypothetical protein
MIESINIAWSWTGVFAKELVDHNAFGNIVFKSAEGEYWRLCPEELSHKRIAEDDSGWLALRSDPEFVRDWEMEELVEIAKLRLGHLASGEKYCLKYPAVLGGEYSAKNIGKISFLELISFSGHVAEQIQSLEDGDQVMLTTTNKESSKKSLWQQIKKSLFT